MSRKGFRNLPQLQISLLKNLNPSEALNYKYIMIEKPEESVKFLESRSAKTEKKILKKEVTEKKVSA